MRSRRTLLLVAALFVTSRAALAQDRLFLHISDTTPSGRNVEIGAIGRFGQPIGPAPADAFTHVFPAARHFVVLGNTIVDSASGALVYSAPAGESIGGWAATPDASRLYVASSRSDFTLPPTLHAVDVATRNEVAAFAGSSFFTTVTWLPADRIVISGAGQSAVALDRDLIPLAVLPLGSYCQPQWLVSPHTGRAYLLTASGYSGNQLSASLAAFDTIAGTKVGDLNLGYVSGCYSMGLALWTAPGPPQRLAAAVLRRDVTLSWLATDLAEGYVLDVGLAPGRTDLSFFVGSSTGVTFASVPPGAYYVRVRAGNVAGGGRPSQEVQIVVP